MNTDEQKRAVARAALEWVEPRLHRDLVLGIGTGSTAEHFIDLLEPLKERFAGAVASSARSGDRLTRLGIPVFDLNDCGALPIYVDGADEINGALEMTKGGGGALTREKIVAAAAATFVCIADASKRVDALGTFPLPIEVIPMARALVARALTMLAQDEGLGSPEARVRQGRGGETFVTDNGNLILDVHGWTIRDARLLETRLGSIVGIVESGLFALRPADLLIVASGERVETIERA